MTMVSVKKPESIWKTKFAQQSRKRIFFKKINKIYKINNGLFTVYPHKERCGSSSVKAYIILII